MRGPAIVVSSRSLLRPGDQAIGQRLQQPEGPHAVGPVAHLDAAQELALEQQLEQVGVVRRLGQPVLDHRERQAVAAEGDLADGVGAGENLGGIGAGAECLLQANRGGDVVEGDDVLKRLIAHQRTDTKDFWTSNQK